MLLLNLSDTAANSQDGSSLEFIAAIAVRQYYIQDASGRGLWYSRGCITKSVGTHKLLVFLHHILIAPIIGSKAMVT